MQLWKIKTLAQCNGKSISNGKATVRNTSLNYSVYLVIRRLSRKLGDP